MAMPTASTELVRRLAAAEPMVVLTGAGISAESGLATFRGPDGLWEGRNPMELASLDAFRDDPLTVWRFYDWRRKQAARAEPNPAHVVLARLERRRPSFLLVTQNVDGLHERAGSRQVLRLHGSLWRLRCTRDGTEVDNHELDLEPFPPKCDCGAMLRPGVVWFGETLPPGCFETAAKAARQADLMLVVGTSALVYPAASLPEIARRSGAYVVEVNPERTPLSDLVDEHLAGPAGFILPALLAGAVQEGQA